LRTIVHGAAFAQLGDVQSPSGRDAAPGDVVDQKYVLRDLIGEGGMARVFRATQPTLDRTVAIKILHAKFAGSAPHVSRFRNEAIAASRVHHPRSIAIIDCGAMADGTPFIVMEYLTGRLLTRIVDEEIVPARRSLDLITHVLSALEAAHAAGVTHGDVKCDNVLVETRDDCEDIKLIDFGLARVFGHELSDPLAREMVVAGTPGYMAPEVTLGRAVTVAADLYGVGVMLYELLTGQLPFTASSTRELLRCHVEEPPMPPSERAPDRGITRRMDEIVMCALAKHPEARYADAAEFALAVRDALPLARRTASGIHRTPSPRPTSERSQRRRLARGSEGHVFPHDTRIEGLRRAIGEALARGNVNEIAETYLTLAHGLAETSRYAAAAHELQEGIDVLGAGPSGAAYADRLAIALAALYEQAGDRDRARRIAAGFDRHTTFAGR
jgi:serine/threonine protein kinase